MAAVLEAIFVPTGEPKAQGERARFGADCYHARAEHVPKVLISGEPVKTYFPDSKPGIIYRRMRKKDVPRDAFLFEFASRNTAENVAYSLDLINKYGIESLHVVSNPSHLWRFEFFFNKAKEEGLIDKDTNITYVPTRKNILFEDVGDVVYGVAAYFKDLIKWRNKELGSLKRL